MQNIFNQERDGETFLQGVEGDWLCLQFRTSVLKREYGIFVKDPESVFPHVYGGIPLQCVEKTYPMKRDGRKFIGIEGLVG